MYKNNFLHTYLEQVTFWEINVNLNYSFLQLQANQIPIRLSGLAKA